MLTKILSGALIGLEAVPIEVEVDVASRGLPNLIIVGLPDKAVEEAKERVRAALHNTGIDFPARRITINLAPADIPKEGPAYDLPIALGILLAAGETAADIEKSAFIGELSLDGSVRRVNGILPFVLMAKEKKFKTVYVPQENGQEASIINGLKIIPLTSLKQLINHLTHTDPIPPLPFAPFKNIIQAAEDDFDMADIYGQEQAKRALEIAAAGAHNLLMVGTPGSGKTLLARTFPTILPSLTEDEAIEVTKIFSITGNLKTSEALVTRRPFRSPHHTTSRNGLIGGGTRPQPGEISLAHRGVLFLDEFPEFPRGVLESLRQPLEDGVVQISRAAGTVRYPCRFTLIAAANPCPCGYYLSKKKPCTCSAGNISRYQKRVSGPLLDRIDLHVNVPEVEIDKLTENSNHAETSAAIRSRVEQARKIQQKRFHDTPLVANGELMTRDIKHFCNLTTEARNVLTQALRKLDLTARSYFKVMKIARTIADLEASNAVEVPHVAEALQYRPQTIQ